MAKEKRETVYHEECMNTAICTAIALHSIHLRSPLESLRLLFRPPTPVFIYIFSLQVDIKQIWEPPWRCGNGREYTSSGHCLAYLWQ